MIRAAAIACVMAAPAPAQPVMTAETCLIGWAAFSDLTDQSARLTVAAPHVTETGWCRIDGSSAELRVQDFESLDWRAVGLEEAVQNRGAPESVEIRVMGIDLIEGLKLSLPPGYEGAKARMQLHLSRAPETRAVFLHDWTTDFGTLGRLRLTGRGGGFDLSSLSGMQITLGGLRVFEADIALETSPALSAALLAGLPRDLARTAVNAVPEDSIDTESRAALLAFREESDRTRGRLLLSARSVTGVGVLQLVGGAMALEEAGPPETVMQRAAERAFYQVTLSASWTPDG